METIDITFKKPLYEYEGSFFIYLRDKYLKEAKKTGKVMKITTPHGIGYFTYEEWMKGAKKMKQIFKFPDRPMILWGNYWSTKGQPSMAEYDDSRLKLKSLWKNVEKKLNRKSRS